MSFNLQSVRVANGSDEEGMLVFNGKQRLVAVLTHLSDRYDGVSGHWYLEAGFGCLDGPWVRGGSVCLNSVFGWLRGASAGVKPPRVAAAN
jgi:hypothetical protein